MKSYFLLFLLSLATSSLKAGNLPLSETNEAEKVQASHQWYLGFGPAFFHGLNKGGTGIGMEAARIWGIESAEIRLAFDFSLKDSAFMGSTGIGANYFFLSSDITPYAGAEFGVGFAKAQGDGSFSGSTNGGFVLAAALGVQIFRHSSVNVDLGLKGSFLLRDTELGSPRVFLVRVGLNI